MTKRNRIRLCHVATLNSKGKNAKILINFPKYVEAVLSQDPKKASKCLIKQIKPFNFKANTSLIYLKEIL